MPGRLRTASRPSSTVMSLASYMRVAVRLPPPLVPLPGLCAGVSTGSLILCLTVAVDSVWFRPGWTRVSGGPVSTVEDAGAARSECLPCQGDREPAYMGSKRHGNTGLSRLRPGCLWVPICPGAPASALHAVYGFFKRFQGCFRIRRSGAESAVGVPRAAAVDGPVALAPVGRRGCKDLDFGHDAGAQLLPNLFSKQRSATAAAWPRRWNRSAPARRVREAFGPAMGRDVCSDQFIPPRNHRPDGHGRVPAAFGHEPVDHAAQPLRVAAEIRAAAAGRLPRD